jgi:hypothetical protein
MTEEEKSLRAMLEAPFPDEVIKQFQKDGVELDYAPWHEYVTRLNDIAFGNWGTDVVETRQVTAPDDDGKRVDTLLVAVRVTVNGAGHTNFGAAEAAKQSWGGAFAEAFSQAFRRACAMHGLGLYLYKDEDWSADTSAVPLTPQQTRVILQVAQSHVITDQERKGIETRITTRRLNRGNFEAALEKLKGLVKERKEEEEEGDGEESG